MIILALLLLLLVAAIVVLMVLAGRADTVRLEVPELNIAWEPTPLMIFLLGAATILLVGLALAMIRAGSRRKMAQRREIKELRRQAKTTPAAGGGTSPDTRSVPSSGDTSTGGSSPGFGKSADSRDPLYIDRDR